MLLGLLSCGPQRITQGKYIGRIGDNIKFINDSLYSFNINTDAGMTAYSKGTYITKHGYVFLRSDFNADLKKICISVKSERGKGQSIITNREKSKDKEVVYEILINHNKWYPLYQPLKVDRRITSFRLRAYLQPGIVYGTVPLIDTLSSEEFIVKTDIPTSFEITSNIDSRDFFRIKQIDTLKIVNKQKIKWIKNNSKLDLKL